MLSLCLNRTSFQIPGAYPPRTYGLWSNYEAFSVRCTMHNRTTSSQSSGDAGNLEVITQGQGKQEVPTFKGSIIKCTVLEKLNSLKAKAKNKKHFYSLSKNHSFPGLVSELMTGTNEKSIKQHRFHEKVVTTNSFCPSLDSHILMKHKCDSSILNVLSH